MKKVFVFFFLVVAAITAETTANDAIANAGLTDFTIFLLLATLLGSFFIYLFTHTDKISSFKRFQASHFPQSPIGSSPAERGASPSRFSLPLSCQERGTKGVR
jgi:hypothetical protein